MTSLCDVGVVNFIRDRREIRGHRVQDIHPNTQPKVLTKELLLTTRNPRGRPADGTVDTTDTPSPWVSVLLGKLHLLLLGEEGLKERVIL